MSFRWFIYYCAVCGGCAALIGWVLGIIPHLGANVMQDALKALCLGLMLGGVLAVIDSLVNFSWAQIVTAALRVLTAAFFGGVGGFFGGMITGAITRGLYWMPTPLVIIGQILGWTLTGLLIGASVGVFDVFAALLRDQDTRGAMRKVIHGLSGGAIGGLLGSLLYLMFLGASALSSAIKWT